LQQIRLKKEKHLNGYEIMLFCIVLALFRARVLALLGPGNTSLSRNLVLYLGIHSVPQFQIVSAHPLKIEVRNRAIDAVRFLVHF
jgi:hypothetical protein